MKTAHPKTYRHTAIFAGAGTGKTTRIIKDIGKQLTHGSVDPSQILFITFSRRAVREMRNRAEKSLGSASDKLTITTFHGFATRVLRRFWQKTPYKQGFTLITKSEVTQLIDDIIASNEIAGVKAKYAYRIIEEYVNTGKWPSNVGAAKKEAIRKLYKALRQHLLKTKQITYSGLIKAAYRLLNENSGVREECVRRFSHIYVDEFQDTNIMQYKLLKLLLGKWTRFFVVGDSDQSIFGWRYVSPHVLEQFVSDFSGTQTKTMTKNYRSTGTIVKAASFLIGHNRHRYTKNLVATRQSGDPIRVQRLMKQEEEGKWIANTISKIRRMPGGNAKTIAILFRHNELFGKIEKQLRAEGIPHHSWKSLAHTGQTTSGVVPKQGLEDASVVHLMTIHGAKSAQFKHVFLPAWEKSRFPSIRSQNIEEERRLAYVALTRAEDKVYISSVLEQRSKPALKLAEVKRSPFLKELPADCVAKYMSKKASKWLHNNQNYIAPSLVIKVGDVVSHNPYVNSKGERVNYGVVKVIAIFGKRIWIETHNGSRKTVGMLSVTKVLLPRKRRTEKKGAYSCTMKK